MTRRELAEAIARQLVQRIEVDAVRKHVASLLEHGISPLDIEMHGIVTNQSMDYCKEAMRRGDELMQKEEIDD